MMNLTLAREICKCCGDINRVGFSIPDELWRIVVPTCFQKHTICLRCFTRWADEKSTEWDRVIKLFPESFVSHRKTLDATSGTE